MTNLENEIKKQSNTTKEETGKFLDKQRQQIANTHQIYPIQPIKSPTVLMNINRLTERF